jgi:hypothetical protein
VINDLSTGEMRVGVHVVSIGTVGGSESFVTNGNIPTPGTLALTACALGCVPFRRKRS